MGDNDEIDINSLVEKYEQMRGFGKKIYFDADEFAALADYFHSIERHEEADEIVNQGLIIHPENQELLVLQVKSLVYSEQYEEAYAFLNDLGYDDDVDMKLLMIECLLNLGKGEEADKIIAKTLQDDELDEDYYFFITEVGFLFNDVDNFERAIHFLEESLKIEEANPDVLIDLAYAYEMQSNFDKAIEYNNKLLDIDPYSFDGWVNIGKLYSMNSRYDKAIDAFDFALTINENDFPTLKMKALSLYLNDNVEEAIRIFENCILETPDDESLYESLIEGYEAMEQYDRVMRLLDRKEEKFGSKGIMLRRALVYAAQEKFPIAEALFKLVPEEDKDTLDYYMLEGELAFYHDDLLASEMAFMKASLVSPDDEMVIDRLANVSVAREKFEQAAEYLEQLLKIDPDFPTAKSRLAFIRFEIGAKEPFDEIMKQFSDEELYELLTQITNVDDIELSALDREKILVRLNEARENRVLFKNIKY
jgi:tetratricopeptide (TPR) repeat protein